MLYVWGFGIGDVAARRLVATLVAASDPDSLSAAAAISRALDDDGGLVGLDPEERDAVLFALIDDGGDEQVAELRGALGRDHVHRHGHPPVE